jgi:hypothetical protein
MRGLGAEPYPLFASNSCRSFHAFVPFSTVAAHAVVENEARVLLDELARG